MLLAVDELDAACRGGRPAYMPPGFCDRILQLSGSLPTAAPLTKPWASYRSGIWGKFAFARVTQPGTQPTNA